MSEMPPELRERVLGAAARRPSMTKGAFRRRRSVVLLSLALMLAAIVFMRGMPAAGGRPLRFILIAAGGAGLVALLASVWVLDRGSSTLGRSRPSLRQLAGGAPVFVLAASLLGNYVARETLRAPSPQMMAHLPCFMMSLVLGGIVLAGLTYLERGSDPVAPRSTGASLGAVAGSWTSFVMAIQCPAADPAHVTATHVLPILALALAGAAAGARWIAVREARPVKSSSTQEP